jgi:hypothetical protein
VYIWEALAHLIGSERIKIGRDVVELPRRRSWLIASPILALALIPLFTNWKSASRAGHTDTADFAHDMLNSVEPYGVLVTVGDNDTFPLWYAQEVEGIRKDVVVANTSLLNTDWYVRQMIRRPVFEYDMDSGPAIYRGKQWTKPSGPPVSLTIEQANALPPYVEIREPQIFRKGTLVATVQPQVLDKASVLVLRIIADAFPERPIYLARTSGSYGRSLGLDPYLIQQGLARKLLPAIPTADRDTVMLQGEGWFDLPRSRALWQEVFQAPKSIIERGHWVDRASVGIPYLYISTQGHGAGGSLRTAGASASPGRYGAADTVRHGHGSSLRRVRASREDAGAARFRGGGLDLIGKAPVLKTGGLHRPCGFESHALRCGATTYGAS